MTGPRFEPGERHAFRTAGEPGPLDVSAAGNPAEQRLVFDTGTPIPLGYEQVRQLADGIAHWLWRVGRSRVCGLSGTQCTSCDATDRLWKAGAVFDEAGDQERADALYDLADRAARRDPVGLRVVAALLGALDEEPTDE